MGKLNVFHRMLSALSRRLHMVDGEGARVDGFAADAASTLVAEENVEGVDLIDDYDRRAIRSRVRRQAGDSSFASLCVFGGSVGCALAVLLVPIAAPLGGLFALLGGGFLLAFVAVFAAGPARLRASAAFARLRRLAGSFSVSKPLAIPLRPRGGGGGGLLATKLGRDRAAFVAVNPACAGRLFDAAHSTGFASGWHANQVYHLGR